MLNIYLLSMLNLSLLSVGKLEMGPQEQKDESDTVTKAKAKYNWP